MICTTCKLKNDQADANQPDGTYLCYDCRPAEAKPEIRWSPVVPDPSVWIPAGPPGQFQYNTALKHYLGGDYAFKGVDRTLDTFETDTQRWVREMDEAHAVLTLPDRDIG